MRVAKRILVALLLTLAGALGEAAFAQSQPGYGGALKLGVIAGVGALSTTVGYGAGYFEAPGAGNIQWAVNGTPPTACTFQLEGRNDASLPFEPLSDVHDCKTHGTFAFTYWPYPYLRVNVLTYTAGDGTTSVPVWYGKGRQ